MKMAARLISLTCYLTINLFAQDVILEGDINKDLLLTANKTYLLKGCVRIQAPAALKIESGTTIYGDREVPGTLIIKPGAKIIAAGSKDKPIVFTSEFAREGAERKPQRGDWGGLIILGKAPINVRGGVAAIEGPGDPYGGYISDDSSGVLRYIRIEYTGSAWSAGNKIAAITFGGVGSKTVIENIQVSFSSNDSFSWFGGTVNGRNLIAYKSSDDDFEFQFGYQGNLQFLLSIRDKDIADVSGSNGMESENDGSGSLNEPRTLPTVYNATLIGPAENSQTAYNQYYRSGMHLRRASQGKYHNILIIGWPTGSLIDGKITAQDAQHGNLQLKNSIISGSILSNLDTVRTDGSFNITNWFMNNQNRIIISNSEAELIDPFNPVYPKPAPMLNSPVLTGAASPPDNGFFDTTANYIGAFGENNWLEGWSKFNYDNFTGIGKIETPPKVYVLSPNYPNPFNSRTCIAFSLPEMSHVRLTIYDIHGREVTMLLDTVESAGQHIISWNGLDYQGRAVASGVYFSRIRFNGTIDIRKMLLVR